MEDNLTKAGYTRVIQFIEGNIIDAGLTIEELTNQLNAKEALLEYYYSKRNSMIFEAREKGIELEPKDFMIEL